MFHHATTISAGLDFETKKLLVRLALAAAIAGLLVWLARLQLDTMRQAFAKKWQMNIVDVKQLYARRSGKLGFVLKWLMAGPLFVMSIAAIVMVLGANANDIKVMFRNDFYIIPFLLVMMGLNFLLMPARDIAYGLRLKTLKPADFASSPTLQDFEAALTAPPPHYYGFRIAGLIFLALAGTLIWAETTYHPQTWLDAHLPHAAKVTSNATPSILPVTVKTLTPATK